MAGRDRLAAVYVPRSVAAPNSTGEAAGRAATQGSGTHATPALVLALHGTGSGPLEQLRMSALDAAADRHGFVVAAPQGATRSGAGFAWDHGSDVDLLLAVADALAEAGLGDPGRVFATGLSGGARLACEFAARHPARVAGVAAVAGLRADAPASAGPSRPDATAFTSRLPVPVVAFHGTADPVNPFDGAGPPYWGYSVRTALARWAEANGCAREPAEDRVTRHVTKLTYPGCAESAETVLYVVDGGGHTWPGSSFPFPAPLGPVTMEIDATATIWEFFSKRTVARRDCPSGT